jgi:DNA invertase Pin-like site-specific DNA recombinase
MKRVFAYLRVSGKGQVEGDGFPRQREAITAYCKAHDLVVKEWFQEEGVSGTLPSESRPAWLLMWNALETNGTKTIIIERLDRLARDLMIQETLLGDLKKNGFEILSTAEPDLDSNEPTRKLIRQVVGAVAEYDRAMIAAKLRGARDRNSVAKAKKLGVAHARVEGRKPFGTRDGEQAIIKQITELAAQGAKYDAIATTLNTSKCKPRSGKRWYACSVRNILLREEKGATS